MLKKIIDFFIKPYNLAKTKVYLFSLLVAIFMINIIYIKISTQNDILQFFSENSTPTIILGFILVIFMYMIFVDSKDSKRKHENRKHILDILEKNNLSDNLKQKLIEKLDDNL